MKKGGWRYKCTSGPVFKNKQDGTSILSHLIHGNKIGGVTFAEKDDNGTMKEMIIKMQITATYPRTENILYRSSSDCAMDSECNPSIKLSIGSTNKQKIQISSI